MTILISSAKAVYRMSPLLPYVAGTNKKLLLSCSDANLFEGKVLKGGVSKVQLAT